MTQWLSAPAARWLGGAAAIAGGVLLYRFEHPTDEGPEYVAIAVGFLVATVVATWISRPTRPGWVGVVGFWLSAIALGTGFLALIGISLSSTAGEGEVAVSLLPAAVVGGVFFALSTAFRHARTGVSSFSGSPRRSCFSARAGGSAASRLRGSRGGSRCSRRWSQT